MKLLYTYFWKRLPIGALIWLTPICLIWAQIAQPTSNHLKRVVMFLHRCVLRSQPWGATMDWKSMRHSLKGSAPIVSPVPQNYGEALVTSWSMSRPPWSTDEWITVRPLFAALFDQLSNDVFLEECEHVSLKYLNFLSHDQSQSHDCAMVTWLCHGSQPPWVGREATQKPAKVKRNWLTFVCKK